MTAVTEKNMLADQLLSNFETQLPSLFGDAAMRREAAGSFAEKGVPGRKWEDYKYINPEGILKKGFAGRTELMRTITPHDVAEMVVAPGAHTLVMVNGIYSPELSKLRDLPEGVTVENLANASSDEIEKHYGQYATIVSDPFVAFNTALAADGVFIHIAKDTQLQFPIHLVHITSNEVASVIQSRSLIVLERGAQAEIVETFESIGPVKYFLNSVTEISVGENARLDHYRVQVEGETAHQLNTSQASVSASALYNNYTYTFGGAFIRNNTNIVMAQPTAEAHMYGLYLLHANQVCDNHTVVDHRVPNCLSNELYKGVITDKATAVFNGKIFVRPDAQKTNAYQTNKNVLLSDDATVNTKPQLEIYADDVKCSHGTSTGRLDENALFYLRARGISEESARRLLIRAFADEVTEKVKIDALQVYIAKRIDERLG